MHVLVFEDEAVNRLWPINLTRPTFTISCGGYRLVDHLSALGAPVAAILQPHLTALYSAEDPWYCDLATWQTSASRGPQLALAVNARLVPSAAVRSQLEELLDAGKPGVALTSGALAAALIPVIHLPLPSEYSVTKFLSVIADLDLPLLAAELPLFEYAHDVVRYHLYTLGDNLQLRLRHGAYQNVADGVFSVTGSAIGPHVCTDTRDGPIVIEADAEIGPFCVLTGPLYIDSASRIREHASIGACTSVGHGARVGGEVTTTIIESFSNKQHDGFLGHSYVGSWVNLGAGTCISNLKNTYGEINVLVDGRKIGTGMQFLGAILGDFAKSAINTSIYTGKIIGVASFLYGTVADDVPSFVNYAHSFGQITTATVDAVATMQRRMFARRGRTQEPEDRELLDAVFALTQSDRSGLSTATGPPNFC